MTKPHIFFGSPTARAGTTAKNTGSIAAASNMLGAKGIAIDYCSINGYDVARQRDVIAHHFLQSSATHLMFTDSDIGFKPDLPLTLLSCAKPLIGAIYPHRDIDVPRAELFCRNGHSLSDALELSRQFAFKASNANIQGDLMTSDDLVLGAGCMLIARECFEQFELHHNVRRYRDHGSNLTVREFFPWGWDGDELYPEDWNFCRRFRQSGGEVFAYIAADIAHVGVDTHTGNFKAFLAATERAKTS